VRHGKQPTNVHPIQPPLQHAALAAKISHDALAGTACYLGRFVSKKFKKIKKFLRQNNEVSAFI
jgi:hypothetical protein